MYFKHPLILLALLLLIIPIIVHLFKLQKFTKTPFTNVKFLKNILLKNRRSSKLKKLLVLISRMLFFLFLILAFAQPYISKKNIRQKSSLIIYLDNSFSLQTKDKNITTLQSAIQNLLRFKSSDKITLLTNNNNYTDLTLEQFRIQLSKIKFSAQPFSLNHALLKIVNIIKKSKSDVTCYILSDFQKTSKHLVNLNFDKNINYNLVNLGNKNLLNQFIDSVYITNKNATNWLLNVIIKKTDTNNKVNIPISLYNNSLLIAKSVIQNFKSNTAVIHFPINKFTKLNGKLSIDNPFLTFDNNFFFTINPIKKVRVLNIGKSSRILKKLFYGKEFLFIQKNQQNLDYTKIKSKQLIILNELLLLTNPLKKALKSFINNGGSVIIIPNNKTKSTVYTNFLKLLKINAKITKQTGKQLITKINYNHPLFGGVFEKPVRNFDYPSVKWYFKITSHQKSSILKFADNNDFISQFNLKKSNIYLFASSIDKLENTFKNSPLIVPVFYNIAKQSAHSYQLYYTINNQNNIKIETQLNKDEVLKLKKADNLYIPQQQIFANYVILKTYLQPDKQGIYKVLRDSTVIQNLAFNYNRNESLQNYYTKSELFKNKYNIHFFSDINAAFKAYKLDNSIIELWKIYIALSLLFYLIELLLLKHLKK